MSLKFNITLPTEIREPESILPDNILFYGLPKCGKTTHLVTLPNHLIIDVERGAGKVAGNIIAPDESFGPVETYEWLKAVAAEIRKQNKPYDFVCVETISYLDELSEWVGTYNYMNHPQGQKFNRVDGKRLPPNHPDYDSVHNIGEGYGYKWSRNAFLDIMSILTNLGKKCTIFTCHLEDKYISAKTSGNNSEIRIMELSLTGKLKSIVPRRMVDGIGYVYNKKGVLNVSFRGNEEKIGGMRGAPHMKGYEGPLDWNQLFLLNNENQKQ